MECTFSIVNIVIEYALSIVRYWNASAALLLNSIESDSDAPPCLVKIISMETQLV